MSHFQLCLTGSFGNRDIGDEAMLTETLDYLVTDRKIPRSNIHLFGFQPDYIAWYHDHPKENCHGDIYLHELGRIVVNPGDRLLKKCRLRVRNWWRKNVPLGNRRRCTMRNRCLSIVTSSDGLIITGGGTINTRNPQGSSLHRLWNLTRPFVAQDKPIFFCAQTIGPLGEFAEHDRIAREIIENADRLFARDHRYSRRYLDLLGCTPKHFQQTYDDAASLPFQQEQLPEPVATFLERGDAIALNVTLYTSETQQQREFIARLAESLIEHFNMNVIFVSHTEGDLQSLYKIYDSVANACKDRILVPDTRNWRDKTLKKLIASCRLAIGGRYHFLVFAGSSDTPFVGMSGVHYSYIKNDGFARIFGHEDLVLTEKETWNLSAILAAADRALQTKLTISSQIERPSPTMQELGRWLDELGH